MPSSSNLLGRIAALSLLATIDCSGAHECSMGLRVGTAEGSLVFVNSAAYQRARAEWTATLDGGAVTLARELDDEVEERADLGGHEAFGVVVRAERPGLVRPAREDVHEPTVGDRLTRVELEQLGDALAPP